MCRLAALVMLVIACAGGGVGGCGRIGFDSIASIDAAPPFTILSVSPGWVPPAGGGIRVTLSIDAAGVAVSIDGSACTSPTITSATITCTAPPHASGVVDVVATASIGSAPPHELVYVDPGYRQLGGPGDDRTSGVAVDLRGNVFITGATNGALDGPNRGDFDAVTAKFDASGALLWVRQLGSPLYDYARDVAVDPAGEVTITGATAGDLGGTGNQGSNDVFVARYAADGTLLWVTQTGSTGDDQALDLGVDDAGNTVVAIQTSGALAPSAGGQDYAIARYTSSGALDWVRQGGTAADDFGHSVAVASDGTAYLVGYTTGSVDGNPNAGGLDMFVARYDTAGTQMWIRQRGGAGDDSAEDVQLDTDGHVWIVGNTTATLDGTTSGGSQDVFLMRFATDGTWDFTRQYGGTGAEATFGVAPSNGNVYLECNTTVGFDGQPFIGGPDDFCVIALDHGGIHLWTHIFGSLASDQASSCALDQAVTGFIYVSLITSGSLDGMPNRGGNDIALAKVDAGGVLQ